MSTDSQHTAVSLRPYETTDENAAIGLWLRTWQAAYPSIDFTARVDWWRERWRSELVPSNDIVVAEAKDAMLGFVTVNPQTSYLDQIVVAPECWGHGVADALITVARHLSPLGLDLDVNTDNDRAIGFYTKQGFAITGAGANPISGKPIHRMSWRPQT
jgi:putative acetyltransferase